MYQNVARKLFFLYPPALADFSIPKKAAVVSISGKAKQFVGPQIYRINTFGKGVCSSAEGIDIMFPAPGDQVFYANGMSASSPVVRFSTSLRP